MSGWPWDLIALYAVGGLVALLVTVLRHGGRLPFGSDPSRPVYAVAAEACGLTQTKARAGFWWGHTLEGRAGRFRVRFDQIDMVRKDEGDRVETATRILIEGVEGETVPVTLRRESRGFLQRDLSAREIEIGDKAFDDDFHVTGPHTYVRALLDAGTRRNLRALLLQLGLEVTRGQLRGEMRVTTPWPEHERTLGRLLGDVLELARHFERPRSVVALLAGNARNDPLPEVRLRNLQTLIGEYPDDPATEEALVAACADASQWIRVRAATALGERGRPTLLEVIDRDLSDDAAASQAITVLGRSLSPERVREILARALRNRQQGITRACLTALGEGGRGDDVALMAKLLSTEKGDLAVAAADALGATGSPAAEAPLLAALERDIPDLRVAAAQALGRVGTAAAVGPLKDAEARAAGSAFSRAARQAIAEIQARLPDAAPGQLSMASGEAGALSLAEDERGRLSLPADQDRQ